MKKKKAKGPKTKKNSLPVLESDIKSESSDSSKAPHYDTQKSKLSTNTEVEMPHSPSSSEDFETENRPNSQ